VVKKEVKREENKAENPLKRRRRKNKLKLARKNRGQGMQMEFCEGTTYYIMLGNALKAQGRKEGGNSNRTRKARASGTELCLKKTTKEN